MSCQKDANKKKVTQTTKNDERTAKTHKNPNGNLGSKSQRKTNTHDDDKENQSTKSNKREITPTIVFVLVGFLVCVL